MFSQRSQRKNKKLVVGEKAREVLEHITDENPTMQLFKQYSEELDDRHDRFERIVKISRDVTIESKRIIFLLHNVATDIEEKKGKIFTEACTRLDNLLQKFKCIAKELEGHDDYQYHKAYVIGIQEYLEAYMFYKYQQDETIPLHSDINERFTFPMENTSNETCESVAVAPNTALTCTVVDVLAGLGDFTGEMMRKCINNLGAGYIDVCFKTCAFVRNIYVGFLGLRITGHSAINKKTYTLRQSLLKMELVCYNIKLRGSEVPKDMLVDAFITPEDNIDEDEGYY